MKKAYPEILAFYRMEKGGMIYEYLNAKTKKQAKEMIRGNGAIAYAVLTMDEAYKIAYCTTEFTTKGFQGVLNTKNSKKVIDVQCFLSECFFYDNPDMVEAYEKDTKIDSEIAKKEVKIAHLLTEVKRWEKMGILEESTADNKAEIAQLQAEIVAKKAETEKAEQQRLETQQKMQEETQKIEKMLAAHNVEIVETEMYSMSDDTDGVVYVTVKHPYGHTEKITKYLTLDFYATTINETISGENIVSFDELEKLVAEEFATAEKPVLKFDAIENECKKIVVPVLEKNGAEILDVYVFGGDRVAVDTDEYDRQTVKPPNG